MAFKIGDSWVSFNGLAVGTGSTKYLAKSAATIRTRFARPLQVIVVAALLALTLTACTPENNADAYMKYQCDPVVLAMKNNRQQRLQCSVAGKMLEAGK